MKRLAVKVGEYEDKENPGKMKGEYMRLGVLMDGQHGEYLLLDPSISLSGCLLKQRLMNAGKENKGKGDMVLCSVFDDDRQPAAQSQFIASPVVPVADFDDEIIPF